MTSAQTERGKFPQQRAVQAGTELRVADPPGQQQQPTSPRHRLESARWAHTALQRCLHPSCLAHGEASSPESPVYLWACCGVCHCDCGGAHVLPWGHERCCPREPWRRPGLTQHPDNQANCWLSSTPHCIHLHLTTTAAFEHSYSHPWPGTGWHSPPGSPARVCPPPGAQPVPQQGGKAHASLTVSG